MGLDIERAVIGRQALARPRAHRLKPAIVDVVLDRIRQQLNVEDLLMRVLVLAAAAFLIVFVLLPLWQISSRSFLDQGGRFIGLANYVRYFSTPALAVSVSHSLLVALCSTAITVTVAFIFAYALTRSAMRGKDVFQTLALLPLFAPSLLHGIAFIYLFGNKGIITTGGFGWFAAQFGFDPAFNIGLYRSPVGIILAECFYLLPHTLLILVAALRLADARLYEAATALRASPARTFFTVTLPGAKYGLISAAFVCFTLVLTDFGVPKVIGGSYNVLATDIYKQVIGQQNFVMGATVSVLLLTPTILGFIIDRLAQRRQAAALTGRTVPLQPRPNPLLDWGLFVYCAVICLAVVAVIGVALMASLVNAWPYDLSLTLRHYDFDRVGGGGMAAYWNSVRLAVYTAVFGAIIVLGSAYLIEKGRGLAWGRAALYFLSTLPVALPGLVLGLGYIFLFNQPAFTVPLLGLTVPSPLNWLYGTMAILVLSTIVHFYTVGFFTATASLKQIDSDFENVASSLRVPFYHTFWRVTLPIALPAVLEIAVYYFVNAMTTVSAVIFLYAADLKLASVAVVNMDDAGDTASAAAMSMLILATGIIVRMLYERATRGLRTRMQVWMQRST